MVHYHDDWDHGPTMLASQTVHDLNNELHVAFRRIPLPMHNVPQFQLNIYQYFETYYLIAAGIITCRTDTSHLMSAKWNFATI